MELAQFHTEYIPEAAALFVQGYERQRLAVPTLPALMEDRTHVAKLLEKSFDSSSGVVALEGGRVAGYLAWFLVDRFRDTNRKGAYVPEWAHACLDERKQETYQALYRSAGETWSRAGCGVHAVTVLAADSGAERAWYWNGFGLTVVDAIRPMQPVQIPPSTSLRIHKGALEDVEDLTELDSEHWQHYERSPVFMTPRLGLDNSGNVDFLSRSGNAIWLASDGDVLVGFIRFADDEFGAATLKAEDGITITGAYVRPEYRRRNAALAMLDAGLRDYGSRGFTYCAVDFESFNPEAASFWMKYFQPVSYSLLRVPEAGPDGCGGHAGSETGAPARAHHLRSEPPEATSGRASRCHGNRDLSRG